MLNEKGQEVPDPTPIEVPLNFRRPPSLTERIKSIIAHQLSQQAAETGAETFEEANDFDVDEDPDFHSPYEVLELQEEPGFQDADNGDTKNASRQDTASPTTSPPASSGADRADQKGEQLPERGKTDAGGGTAGFPAVEKPR